MASTPAHGYVVRLRTPPGKMFPVQEYLRLSDSEWFSMEDGGREKGDILPWQEADDLAKKLTSKECHVYPVATKRRDEPAMPARSMERALAGACLSPQDWHAGKPNCGVD